MIWILTAAALMAATMAWMIYLVTDHHRRPVVAHLARFAIVPAGIVATSLLAVAGLQDLTEGLPL